MNHTIEIISCERTVAHDKVYRDLVVKIDGIDVRFMVVFGMSIGCHRFIPKTHKDVTKHPDWKYIRKSIGSTFKDWAKENAVPYMGTFGISNPLFIVSK